MPSIAADRLLSLEIPSPLAGQQEYVPIGVLLCRSGVNVLVNPESLFPPTSLLDERVGGDPRSDGASPRYAPAAQ